MSTRTRRATIVAAAIGALMLAFQGPAMAVDNVPGSPPSSCPGSLVSGFTNPITKKYGSDVLKLYVYYSPANGGTNCAIARKSGPWYGEASDLGVNIWKTAKGTTGRWPDEAYDDGNYKYYAGAVYITGTNGVCISVAATPAERDSIVKNRFACG